MVIGQMADGMQQMCLALAGAAVDEERVVTDPRILSYLHSGGICHAVEIADDEVVEGVPGVEYVAGGPCACPSIGVVYGEGCRRLLTVVNQELNIHVLAKDGDQGLPYQRVETPGQPLGNKDAGDTDNEEIVFVAYPLTITEPGVVVGPAYLYLKLPQNSLPDFLC